MGATRTVSETPIIITKWASIVEGQLFARAIKFANKFYGLSKYWTVCFLCYFLNVTKMPVVFAYCIVYEYSIIFIEVPVKLLLKS